MDYDVLVIGSGFGGSVAALRLTEKGYRVGVLEAGRRFEDDEFAKNSWHLKQFLWAPALGLLRDPAGAPAAQRALPDGRGRGRRVAGLRQHPLPPARPVLRRPALVPHHRLEVRARAVLRPGGAHARRRPVPRPLPGRRRHPAVADDMGVGDTFRPTRVGVYFGPGGAEAPSPGRRAADPFFGGAGPERDGLHRVRRVHDRLPPRRQEHPGQELPLPRGARGRRGAPAHHGRRRPAAARRRRLRDHARTAPAGGGPARTVHRASRSCSPPARWARSACCTP